MSRSSFMSVRKRAVALLERAAAPDTDGSCAAQVRLLSRELSEAGLASVDPAESPADSLWRRLAVAEALGTLADAGLAMGVTIHLDMVLPMVATQVKNAALQSVVQRALRGDALFAHALSETSSGSALDALTTSARKVHDGYRVEGTKHMISLAADATHLCTLARCEGRKAPFDMVLLLVERSAHGVEVSAPLPLMGHRSLHCHDVSFRNVWVPEAARVGDEGVGLALQVAQFVPERVISSARANGAASTMLDELWSYAEGRATAQATLAREPRVRAELARLRSLVERSRAATFLAADALLGGRAALEHSAIAKFISSRTAREVGRYAARLHGARGYVGALRGSAFHANARLFSLSTGSDEMMLRTLINTQKLYDRSGHLERA